MENSRNLSTSQEMPKTYELSGLFVIIGLILLHWSHSIYFVAVNGAFLVSFAAGFSLLVAAVFLRASAKFEVLWQQSHDRARFCSI